MGLLSEPHHEEADHADPFYAHCKLHSDKTMLKNRKRNYNALQVRLEQKTLEHEAKRMEVEPTAEHQRVERKLKKHKKKYMANKAIKVEPWGEYSIPFPLPSNSLTHCPFSSHTEDAPLNHNQRFCDTSPSAQSDPNGHRFRGTGSPRGTNCRSE